MATIVAGDCETRKLGLIDFLKSYFKADELIKETCCSGEDDSEARLSVIVGMLALQSSTVLSAHMGRRMCYVNTEQANMPEIQKAVETLLLIGDEFEKVYTVGPGDLFQSVLLEAGFPPAVLLVL